MRWPMQLWMHSVKGLSRYALCKGPVQILAHHGAITRGPTLWRAFELMECLEHAARITALAKMLGEPALLPGGKV